MKPHGLLPATLDSCGPKALPHVPGDSCCLRTGEQPRVVFSCVVFFVFFFFLFYQFYYWLEKALKPQLGGGVLTCLWVGQGNIGTR